VIGFEDRRQNDLDCDGWGIKLYSNSELLDLPCINLPTHLLLWNSLSCFLSESDRDCVMHGVYRTAG